MKKINWFQRLFLGWDTLVKIIKESDGKSEKENEELFSLRSDVKNLNERIDEKKKEIINLIESYKNTSELQTKMISEKQEQINELTSKVIQAQTEGKELRNIANDSNREISLRDKEIETLREKILLRKNDNDHIKREINEKLKTLSKIDKTFFGKAGNKGKGELGEMQVKTILEKMDFNPNFWIENLKVGKSIVEFAIRAGIDEKWIPVDSKVIEAEIIDGKVVIDESYKGRVKKAAKEITKYIGKNNTTHYGVLVLPNDSIYAELFNNFPTFFQEISDEFKVQINSPSTFIQSAWNISNIIDIYNRIHQDEEIYDDMISAINTVNKFASSLNKVHKNFNIAMDSHYPALQNKQTKLIKRLTKSGKLKELPKLNKK